MLHFLPSYFFLRQDISPKKRLKTQMTPKVRNTNHCPCNVTLV